MSREAAVATGVMVLAVWAAVYVNRPPPALATGGLPRFSEIDDLHVRLIRDVDAAMYALSEAERDQERADESVLLCEHLGRGVLGRGERYYYCVRDGKVLFARAVGREMMWWRRRALMPAPEQPPRPEPDLLTPWVTYAP